MHNRGFSMQSKQYFLITPNFPTENRKLENDMTAEQIAIESQI